MLNERTTPAARPRRTTPSARIQELQAAVDERDEIIRQLNEALSRALDELTLDRAA